MTQNFSVQTSAPVAPVFNFRDCSVRTIMQDGQPWFVARDVCTALNIDWSGKTLAATPTDWKGMGKLPTPRGGNQNLRIISEPAVYKLAFRSNKPEADEFTNWVACEVLPAIRKTGKYEVAPKPKRSRKALEAAPAQALPCAEPVLDPTVYLKGKKLFDFMARLMTDFDLVKSHVQIFAHPGGRYARLSPELETIYQNAADASKMALCSLTQAQYALRIAMGIKTAHKFDER